MADSTQDSSSLDCIPEIFLERRSAQSTHHSHHGRVQPRGEGVDETGKQPTAGESNEDLVKEGFIPYNELKLHHLPEAIRTQKNLERILSIGERVVCVNNNQLSEERDLEEDMKMEGATLKGTGFVLSMGFECNDPSVTIFTNRHVLYNLEEIRKSSLDFNFDSYRGENQVREWERTKRGSGLFGKRQNSKVDFCTVTYDLDSKSKTSCEIMKSLNERLLISSSKSAASSVESLGKGIVCVISHPLGRWKHVSFGEIVTCRPQDNIFLYDAPTKPGSSGAPIIVFGDSTLQVPEGSLFYHEGVDRNTNLKKGHVQIEYGFNSLPWLFQYSPKDKNNSTDKKRLQKRMEYVHRLSADELRQHAAVDIHCLRLGAFFPIFAAFILHPEKYCSRVLTLPGAPPCKSLSKHDVELSVVDQRHMAWRFSTWAPEKPSLFPLPTAEFTKSDSDLSSFLTTEAPCWCQAIVEAVVHTSRSDKDTGVFLRPDAVCGDFRQDPRWPWSLDRCGGKSGRRRKPMLKHCLLKECLDVFRGTTVDRDVPLHLLVLIRRANDIVRQSPYQTPQAKHGCPGFTRTTNVTSTHSKSDDQRPVSAPTENVSSSDLKQLQVVSDVFLSHHEIAPRMAPLSCWIQGSRLKKYTEIFVPRHPGDECVKNFHKALGFISHLQDHHYYDHPDSASCSPQEVPWPRPRCECGRPFWTDVTKASLSVRRITTNLLQSGLTARGESTERPRVSTSLNGPCYERKPTENASFDTLLDKAFVDSMSTHGLGCPLEKYLSRLDSLDNFRNSCDLISVGLTSLEVFLFNTRNLLRQYRHHLFPVYISGPVSVFGRPGRWAGGHTPQEVKDTAWKLIRAACTESSFGRECLEVLERDTAQREKLIDLYVDMKQLKFSGDIEEEKMTVENLVEVKTTQMMRETMIYAAEFVDPTPTYFVLRTFLKLVPWPSLDQTWQKRKH